MKMSLKTANQTKKIFLWKTKMKKEDTDCSSNLKKYINLMRSSSQDMQASMKFRFRCRLKNPSRLRVFHLSSAKASTHNSYSSHRSLISREKSWLNLTDAIRSLLLLTSATSMSRMSTGTLKTMRSRKKVSLIFKYQRELWSLKKNLSSRWASIHTQWETTTINYHFTSLAAKSSSLSSMLMSFSKELLVCRCCTSTKDRSSCQLFLLISKPPHLSESSMTDTKTAIWNVNSWTMWLTLTSNSHIPKGWISESLSRRSELSWAGSSTNPWVSAWSCNSQTTWTEPLQSLYQVQRITASSLTTPIFLGMRADSRSRQKVLFNW